MVGEWLVAFERIIISGGIGTIFLMVLYNWLVDPVLSRLVNEFSPFATPIAQNSEEAIMTEAKEILDGWYTIRKDGEIILTPPPKARMDSNHEAWRKPVLYIFAAKDAYDMGKRESPQVSHQELIEKSVPSDPEFLSVVNWSHWINYYEGEVTELDSDREVITYDADVDKEVFELSGQDYEILTGDKLGYDREVMVVDHGEEFPGAHMVFELDSTKATEAAEYVK